MTKIRVISVGKTKEVWLETALNEYVKRLQPWTSIEWIWAKNDIHLLEILQKEMSCIALDPLGKMYTSEEFSRFIQKKVEEGGARLTFIIGGPEGLPPELKQRYPLLSLSPLTFTHQLTRLILLEQIYRAYAIEKGIPYHK